jgi:hypothetical protein
MCGGGFAFLRMILHQSLMKGNRSLWQLVFGLKMQDAASA